MECVTIISLKSSTVYKSIELLLSLFGPKSCTCVCPQGLYFLLFISWTLLDLLSKFQSFHPNIGVPLVPVGVTLGINDM